MDYKTIAPSVLVAALIFFWAVYTYHFAQNCNGEMVQGFFGYVCVKQ